MQYYELQAAVHFKTLDHALSHNNTSFNTSFLNTQIVKLSATLSSLAVFIFFPLNG